MYLFVEDFIFDVRPDCDYVLVAVNNNEAVLPLILLLGRLLLFLIHVLFLRSFLSKRSKHLVL